MDHASILASTALTKAPEDIDRFYEEHGHAMPRLALPRLPLASFARLAAALKLPRFARTALRA